MIINVRGTNGSGKSTVVRRVMGRLQVKPVFIIGRRRPYGYRCSAAGRDIYVPGHYETPTGGCDTIATPAEAFESINQALADGMDVLFEGIIVQDSVTRLIEMAKASRVAVIALDVPIETCLASVRERRDRKGDSRPLDPANTVNRLRSISSSMKKIAEAGIDARWASRDEAMALCLEWLGLAGAHVIEHDREFRLTP